MEEVPIDQNIPSGEHVNDFFLRLVCGKFEVWICLQRVDTMLGHSRQSTINLFYTWKQVREKWKVEDVQRIYERIHQKGLYVSVINYFKWNWLLLSTPWSVAPHQTCLQKVWWTSSSVERVSEYALNTVTYRIRSAPYLAIRKYDWTARTKSQRFPELY